MSAAPSPSEDEQDRLLGEAVDAYLDRLHRGERISPEQWIARFPNLAQELRDCLSALDLVKAVATPLEASREPVTDGAAAPTAGLPRIRGYAVLQEISRGGMGIVYRAVQLSTKRVVALKLMAGDLATSASARRRFEREVELAAALDHPGIVRIYESGESEAGVYCAMEYVTGRTLHDYLTQTSLSVADKLWLFISISDAVQFAHVRGVVHRDLKPSNIMVDEQGSPRILDFGLARSADSAGSGNESGTVFTREGQLVGTLPYLAPEHAAGKARQIDVRGDIYALGVILYEMLAGRLPYDTRGPLDEALHNICHAIPQRPSTFTEFATRDLDAVVLKALEKSPEDRYQSAALLADEIRCHLRGEPVEANRTGSFYLLRKAYARHRTGVRIATGALIIVLAASTIILMLYLQVRRERNRLEDELHASQLRRAVAHLAAGHDILAERLLWPPYLARPDDRRALWSLVSYYVQNPLALHLVSPHIGWIACAAFSLDGRFAACGNLSGWVRIFDASTGETKSFFEAHPGASVVSLVVLSSGELVTAGSDGKIKVWRPGNEQSPRVIDAHRGGIFRMVCSRRGEEVVTCGNDGHVLHWRNISVPQNPTALFKSPHSITAADLSRSGELLALANESGIEILDAHTGAHRARVSGLASTGRIEAVRFSPDERTFACWSGGRVRHIDLANLKTRWTGDTGLSEPRPTSLWNASPTPHLCWTPSMDFSDDGELLICSGWGASVRAWNTTTGRVLGDLRAHETAVYAVAFQPGSRQLLAGCVESLRIWDLDLHPVTQRWSMSSASARTCVSLLPSGGLLTWAIDTNGSLHRVMNSTTGEAQLGDALTGDAQALAIDPAGSRLAAADTRGEVTLWDVGAGRRLKSWAGETPVRCLALSRDGSLLAAGDWRGVVRVWSVSSTDSHSPIISWNAHAPGIVLVLAFSPDGTHVLSGGSDFHARVWSVSDTSSHPLGDWRHDEWVNAVAISPDGTRMATGGADLGIQLGPLRGKPEVRIRPAHAHWVSALAFLDGGRILVSGGNDEALRFWDAFSGQDLAVLTLGCGPIHSLAASEDGHLLAVGASKAVQVLDLNAAFQLIEQQFQRIQKR